MSHPTDHEHSFTRYLASLVPREGQAAIPAHRAALASLRRGLGKQPGEAAEMFPYLMPWIPEEVPPMEQERYFLIASLFAAHQISWIPGDNTERYSNLGASFRRLRAATESESIDKRFVALLNAEREDLPEHLRHAVSLLKAHEIAVDWAQLLHDVSKWGWDAEDRHVQNEWARAFWGSIAAPTAPADVNAQSTP